VVDFFMSLLHDVSDKDKAGQDFKSVGNPLTKPTQSPANVFKSNVFITPANNVCYVKLLSFRAIRLQALCRMGFIVCALTYVNGVNERHAFAGTQPAIDLEIDLEIVSHIESSRNPEALGDGGKSVGLFQISPVCLKDYNLHSGSGRTYTRDDLLNPTANTEVAKWFLFVRIPAMLRRMGYPDNLRNRIVAYNCGISCLNRDRLPRTTEVYIEKYHKLAADVAKFNQATRRAK